MDLRLKKIDKYIMKKFIVTFFIALLLIIGIVIIFDISEKVDDFVEKKAPLHAIIFDYYVNFVPYFMNMFSPLFVFITVIFFTSQLPQDDVPLHALRPADRPAVSRLESVGDPSGEHRPGEVRSAVHEGEPKGAQF